MGENKMPDDKQNAKNAPARTSQSGSVNRLEPGTKLSEKQPESQDEKLARQLRENLAKRKSQSRARNTKPRKFKNNTA